MHNDVDVGTVMGIYTILDVCDERDNDGHLLYCCQCNVCKNIFIRRLYKIKSVKKCTHTNMQWKNKRIGSIFDTIKRRCYCSNSKDYKWYGEKGIRICDEWINNPSEFETWALANGYGETLTIDRIDSAKDYCPTNCQWIPLEDNSRKAGDVNWIDIDGITLTGRQWAEKFGLGINTINKNIRKYGLDKTKELIRAMFKEHPSTKCRKYNQSWFSVYGIHIS